MSDEIPKPKEAKPIGSGIFSASFGAGFFVLLIVGSEVAHSVAWVLATVRRSNCTGSFPAYSFYEDSRFRGTIVGIN